MSLTPSQRGGFVSSPSPRRLPGAIAVPGLFFLHLPTRLLKNPSANVSKPLHERTSCSPTGARHVPADFPKFPSNRPSGVV